MTRTRTSTARDATYIGKTEKNGQKMFWSRGKGWVMGGLARTLEYLPKDDRARSEVREQLREMSAAVAKIQVAGWLVAVRAAGPCGTIRSRRSPARH